MTRVRISTTVDEARWSEAQRLLGAPPSQIIDAALSALIEKVEGDRERLALDQFPYHNDLELSWEVPLGAQLPYKGEIPEEVLRLAEQRRQRRAAP